MKNECEILGERAWDSNIIKIGGADVKINTDIHGTNRDKFQNVKIDVLGLVF